MAKVNLSGESMENTKSLNLKSLAWGEQNITTQALWITMFAALTAVGAQIEIPHQPVPYTLQTFFVLLSGALLGKRNGTFSQLTYLTAGLVGLPVFAGGSFGFAKLIGPTGGYLLSFPVAAFVVGYLLNFKKLFVWALVSLSMGAVVIFSLGTLQLYFVYYHDWALAFTNGFLIFSWWDIIKIVAAAGIYMQFKKNGKAHPNR